MNSFGSKLFDYLQFLRWNVRISSNNITSKPNSNLLHPVLVSPFIRNSSTERKTDLVLRDVFESEDKDKEAFVHKIEVYTKKLKKTGHIEFIYAAMKHMEEFGVHEDLEVYKKLIEVLPVGRFVPTNVIQAEFHHFPRHQECIVDLLQQMEENAVAPDWELQDILVSRFGKRAYPLRRYWRMMYWIPKFKYINPWWVPRYLTSDTFELAKLAVSQLGSVDLETEVSIFKTNTIDNAVDNTWIVSAQSPMQKKLLQNHPLHVPIYIEGPFTVWLRKKSIIYFVMRSDKIKERRKAPLKDYDDIKDLRIPLFMPPSRDEVIPKMTVHEQKDGVIFGIAATGTSSKESLLSWVRILESNGIPRLGKLSVLFRLTSSTEENDFDPTLEIDDPQYLLEIDKIKPDENKQS